MTHYDFVASSLESLDTLQTELIVLPFFADERPLRGTSALLDWRLCGALSRKLMAGYLDGRRGDKGLIAGPSKLKADALLMVGLGDSDAFDSAAAEESSAMIADTLRSSKVTTVALALPGRSLGLVTAMAAMQTWLDADFDSDRLDEMSIIEAVEEHRGLASLFDGLRRQAESPLG